MKAAAMNRIAWMIGQALAIGGLTYMFVTPIGYEGEKPIPPIGALVISTIIVAFGTALLVNTADWFKRTLRYASPARRIGLVAAVFGVPAVIAIKVASTTPKGWEASVAGVLFFLLLVWISCGVVNLSLRAWAWAAKDRNASRSLDARRPSGAAHRHEPPQERMGSGRSSFGGGQVSEQRGRRRIG